MYPLFYYYNRLFSEDSFTVFSIVEWCGGPQKLDNMLSSKSYPN